MLSVLKLKTRLLVKALAPRLCFILQGLFCLDFLVWKTGQTMWFYLLVCLGFIVLEGIFNVVVRNGKEFHWICPSAILFCIVVIATLIILRTRELHYLLDDNCTKPGANSSTYACVNKYLKDPTTKPHLFETITSHIFGTCESDCSLDNYRAQISYIEQVSMGALILGRWALPKGSINIDQFLQIVLIYIGTAADILELSEIFDDDLEVLYGNKEHLTGVYHGTLAVWALGILQFGFTIALPEEGLKQKDEDEAEEVVEMDHRTSGYFRPKFQNKVGPMSYMQYKTMLRQRASGQDGPAGPVVENTKPKGSPNLSKFIMMNGVVKRLKDIENGGLNNRDSIDAFRPKRIHLIEEKNLKSNTNNNSNNNNNNNNNNSNSMTPTSSRNGSLKSHSSTPKLVNSPAPKAPVLSSPGSNTLASPLSTRSKDSSLNQNITENAFSTPPTSAGQRNNPTKNLWRDVLTKYTYTRHFANGRDIRRASDRQKHDSETEDNSTGVGKKEIRNCFVKYIGVIEMLQCVLFQDGPFFILRMVFWAHYNVTTNMTALLLVKNLLVIVIQVYRILLLHCERPSEEERGAHDLDDASTRVQCAIESNRRLSNKRGSGSRQEYLAAYVLDTL